MRNVKIYISYFKYDMSVHFTVGMPDDSMCFKCYLKTYHTRRGSCTKKLTLTQEEINMMSDELSAYRWCGSYKKVVCCAILIYIIKIL